MCLAAARCRGATQSLSQQRILNREHLALDIAASHLGAYNPLSSPHARRAHPNAAACLALSPLQTLVFFWRVGGKASHESVQGRSAHIGVFKWQKSCSMQQCVYASGKIKSFRESAGKLNKRTSAPPPPPSPPIKMSLTSHASHYYQTFIRLITG